MKKAVVLVMVLVLALSFTGCTGAEKNLYNALQKSNEVSSMEGDTKLVFSLEGENLPKEQQEEIQQAINMMNGAEINMYQKTIQNEEKTASKSYVKTDIKMGNILNTNTEVWAEADLSSDTPKLKEIIKMPSEVMNSIAQGNKDKKFIVYDIGDVLNTGDENVDLNKLINFGKEIQPELLNSLQKYYDEFDPDVELATFKGTRTVNGKSLYIYNVKLDDASFKKLVRYIGNSYLDNEEMVEFTQKYIEGINKAVGVQDKALSKEKLNMEVIGKADGPTEITVKENVPEIKKQFNDFMDKIENLKILGDNGLVVEYGVNSQGYIVHQVGKLDLNIDIGAIEKIANNGEASQAIPSDQNSPVLKLRVDFSTKTYNINKNMEINIPDVNSDNSLTFKDLIQNSTTAETVPAKEVPVQNSTVEVKEVPAEETTKVPESEAPGK